MDLRIFLCTFSGLHSTPRSEAPLNAAITGRGNHVLADGRRGVLREEIAGYLTEDLGLAAAPTAGNDRRLIVCAQDLNCWMASYCLGDSYESYRFHWPWWLPPS